MGSPSTVYDHAVLLALKNAQTAYQAAVTKTITAGAKQITVPYPFPSPADWRDTWIYFLMIDRFNNPAAPPASAWDQQYSYRQGGTFKGIEAQLDYIKSLGAGAIWVTPVLKNPAPEWQYNYHGYQAQDFMTIDPRFSSDNTAATAAKELSELVEAAHARGLYVIVDIVINHSARVFDYLYNNQVQPIFTDPNIINGPPGDEPPIQWLNGLGFPRSDWQDNIPPGIALSADDAVYPSDLVQHEDFFRRRGNLLSDSIPAGQSFVKGDFGEMRQLVGEYDASVTGQQALRRQYGVSPVLNILVQIYSYLMASFDIDAFRIDTVKYVSPPVVEGFCNSMREYGLSIGKKNFFTFGEVWDSEAVIEKFIGRNTSGTDGFGLDAALDYPLFYNLPAVAKCEAGVETLRQVFEGRKTAEQNLISSHGEAGKYFVSFLDNHDQNERFNHPGTPAAQVFLGLGVLFCLQGIPCIYYGTEQGLDGTKDNAGNSTTGTLESVREAIWGKQPIAFDNSNNFYTQIFLLSKLRNNEPALRYGRLYFREISGNGHDFGQSIGTGGVIAFSRILYSREIVIVANTSTTSTFKGFVLMDVDINRGLTPMKVAYSNFAATGQQGVVQINGSTETASLYIVLAPMEIQVIIPA